MSAYDKLTKEVTLFEKGEEYEEVHINLEERTRINSEKVYCLVSEDYASQTECFVYMSFEELKTVAARINKFVKEVEAKESEDKKIPLIKIPSAQN